MSAEIPSKVTCQDCGVAHCIQLDSGKKLLTSVPEGKDDASTAELPGEIYDCSGAKGDVAVFAKLLQLIGLPRQAAKYAELNSKRVTQEATVAESTQ